MRTTLKATTVALGIGLATGHAAAANYLAVLDNQNNFGDSKDSVVFWDAENLTNGPMFAVHLGLEGFGNPEELGGIATNPNTGETYVLAFDSGPAGNLAGGAGLRPQDTEGDHDLFRIDFAAALNDWQSNQGGAYTTYFASGDAIASGLTNTKALPDIARRVGEVARAEGLNTDFFEPSLEFVDDGRLLVMDRPKDSDGTSLTDFHQLRVLNRISSTPDAANYNPATNEGGFNATGNTESWESTILGYLTLDADGNGDPALGEPNSIAYFKDPITGVEGVWMTEFDGAPGFTNDQGEFVEQGDDIGFFEITNWNGTSGNAFREFAVGGGPTFADSFVLDDDPVSDSSQNQGSAGDIFVDEDGSIYIIEKGFPDSPQDEPSVVIRQVTSYDDGNGRITFGEWGYEQLDVTGNDNDSDITDDRFVAFDPATRTVYFYDKDFDPFLRDFYAFSVGNPIGTGDGAILTAALGLDESTGFASSPFTDEIEFFSFSAQTTLPGDFNGDGLVDGFDFDILAQNFGGSGGTAEGDANGDGLIDGFDFDILAQNFGAGVATAVTAVPEPASLALLGLGGLALLRRRS